MTTLEDLLHRRHAAALIIGFVEHTLSEEQAKELADWLDQGDNESLFGKLIDPAQAAFSREWFGRIDHDTDLYNAMQ